MNLEIIKKHLAFHWDGLMNSYAMIFFSKDRMLAVLVLVASFIEPDIGLWGLLAVLVSNIMARLLAFPDALIREGIYGMNGLLVVCGMAASFEVNTAYIALFGVLCFFTLIVSAAMFNALSKAQLPFLSLPFVVVFWALVLAVRTYPTLSPDPRDIYLLNDLYGLGGKTLVNWYETFNAFTPPDLLAGYFKSLSAILFGSSWFTGLFLSLGLLLSSRIAFVLSILGYGIGYAFYSVMGADFSHLNYGFIGFNFILSAIALGGFFYVPSWKTYALVVAVAPVIALMSEALMGVLKVFSLPVISLPFSLLVIMILYTFRYLTEKQPFTPVVYQHYSPESNLYHYQNYQKRFSRQTYYPIYLPFFGEWTISQGYNGEYTHKGEWQHALDFVVTDVDGKTYQNTGLFPADYYCYGLPIVAPADGYVVDVINHVTDNVIGEVNLQENWGNTIVIKHAEGLYTKMSHLKAGSISSKVGDYVTRGTLLGYLGNSGRSPEPHLHFQVQVTPYIGSKTLPFPVAAYMEKPKRPPQSESTTTLGYAYKAYEIPQKNDVVTNVQPQETLTKAFRFVHGQILNFEVETEGKTHKIQWEVKVSTLNQLYLYCTETSAAAYFVNDGTVLYFTTFEGNRKSLLYDFYLGAYKVLLGFYHHLVVNDTIPLHHVLKPRQRFWNDLTAPFHSYLSVSYALEYTNQQHSLMDESVELQATIKTERFGNAIAKKTIKWHIKDGKFESIRIQEKENTTILRQIP
jgi:urea transporter/murein DD-endopeptidase MepM/ murein hydrolase activator NlpD